MSASSVSVLLEEGVAVRHQPASIGERAGAFVIDLLLVALLCSAIGCAGAIAGAGSFGTTAGVLIFLVLFFWFAACEAGRRGATPGKRILRLRVLDCDGRVLTAEAAFVRNLVRWLEVLAIVMLAAFCGAIGGRDLEDWALVLWMPGFALVPFVRKDGRRLGDLAAGTMVVRVPEAPLLGELARAEAAPEAFTAAELDIYGEKELHALEALLRATRAHGATERLAEAGRIIAGKIGRPAPAPRDAERFLRAFYAAQRARLERRLALGRRKLDRG